VTLSILVSPAATGKTLRCVERILQALEAHPLETAWVVLPDRLQSVAFRRRLAAAGGGIGVHIGTFADLYASILLRAGQTTPTASEPILYRLIRSSIGEAMEQGKLVYYAPIAIKPGFVSALRDRFAELKRARVMPEVFRKAARGQEAPLTELAYLYSEYQARLRALGWADPEGVNWLAVEALDEDPDLAADRRLLIVDGFDSFNGSQLAALRLLGQRVEELIITLPGELDRGRAANRRFARSLAALKAALPDAELESYPELAHLPAPLRHLEQRLFEPGPRPIKAQANVRLLETRSPVDEAREVLRWMKARIVRDGLRPDECALVTPDPERYRQYLREAGAEFGLPLRFTHGESLASAPGIAALIDLIALPVLNWPRRSTLDALRTPYFDTAQFGLGARAADQLELVSQFGQVVEGLDQWRESLERLKGMALDEDRGTPTLPYGEEAEALWKSLEAFAERLTPPDRRPIQAWIEWLEDLLEELHFFERQQTGRDQAAAVGLRAALRALVLGGELEAQAPVEFEAALAELRSTLEGTNFQERMKRSRPAILVLRVLEARGLRFRAVAVLGLSEGQFPEIERADPFLSEELRAELGLEPRLGREQAGLFYQAVTRADQSVLLTRPTMAEDGEIWEPSPFWKAARSLLAEEPMHLTPGAPRALNEAASAEEALFLAVRKGGLPKSFGDLSQRFDYLRHARDVLEARLGDDGKSPYQGDLSAVEKALGENYGPDHIWSPSRLEAYGTCPHLFYVGQVMGLEASEPPELGYDPRQLGLMLHAILENAYRQAMDPADAEAVLGTLESAAREEYAAAPERYGFRPSPLWEVEQAHLLERLVETISGMAELGEGWTPVAFESKFGLESAPPLEMEIDGKTVRLRGVIDRVDKNEKGELRVLDYKSGSGHLGPRDLVEGRRLQLPLYALAARDALGLGEPIEGLYWAILAGRRGGLRLSRFKDAEGDKGPQVAFKVAARHVGRILAGVRSGRFRPVPPRGGCPSYCPAAAWCWRYEPASW
jgi:ATP-dependent helicase/DNAse subunit B